MTCVCGHIAGDHKWGSGPNPTGPIVLGHCLRTGCPCRQYTDRDQLVDDIATASQAALTPKEAT